MSFYNNCYYEEATYDSGGIITSTEEEQMQTLGVSIRIDRTDSNSNIMSTTEVEQTNNIPQDISGSDTYLIPAGSVDLPMPNIAAFRDFVCIICDSTNSVELIVKFDSPTNAGLPLDNKGFIIVNSRNIQQILITNAASVAQKVSITQALKQTI
jgi:hypothetical protein